MKKDDFYRDARTDLTGPLHGVTVVETTTTWAGPMAACVLADLGARVIKVEMPGGEVARSLPPFIPESPLTIANETVNRNKESLTLDLHQQQAKNILFQLIEQADIFVENFRPGTLAGWGLGYQDLKAVKNDIIYVSISGFGQYGPLSDRVAYDPLAQSYGGWASLNGEPEGGPTKAPTYLGDDLAGLHGALGAMAALRHRDQTGEGQHVDVALVDSIMFQSNGFPTAGALDLPIPRTGNQFAIAAPVNIYPATNGNVFAGVLLDAHWKLLAAELGREDLAELSAVERITQRDTVDTPLAEYCAARTVEDVVDRFAELGIPATRVHEMGDLHSQPHIQARDMLVPTRLSDNNEVPLTAPPVKFSRTPTQIRNAAPSLRAQNPKILESLGYDADAIAALQHEGII